MIRLLLNARVRLGLGMLALFVAVALLGPSVVPQSPTTQNLSEDLRPPRPEHPFGQDKLGRDVLSRVVYGARVSLLVGVMVAGVSACIGLAVGALAGYAGGWTDELIMRVIDVLLAFPGMLLALALSAVLGPSLRNVLLALCVIGWTGYARLVRAEVQAWRTREFVSAAVALGATPLRVVRLHIVPHLLTPLLVQATFGMAGAIVAEASLSFLGLGVQPPTPSWGAMVNEGRSFLLVAPHVALFPGLAIMLTVLGLHFLGDGLRDALDVRGGESLSP
ncbi:MAG: ABC transporter permease [Candidatus Binatia bacterium]|jgi:peptide/nickel transport system permease protein